MTSSESKRPSGYESATRDQIAPRVRSAINKANAAKAWPILLTGSVGCGKTSAAAVQYGHHRQPWWLRADDLLLSMSYGRRDGIRCESFGWFERAGVVKWHKFVQHMQDERKLVLLDDLGVRAPTEAMHQSLFDLMEWRATKPLLITSNKTPEELGVLYDDRIKSRLLAGTVIEMGGGDRRARRGYRIDATGNRTA